MPDLAPNARCIFPSNLEHNVCLCLTADFFLLPDLKVEIQDYLLERCTAILWWFHDFKLSQVAREAVHNQRVDDHDNLEFFFLDLSDVVVEIYKNPLAR